MHRRSFLTAALGALFAPQIPASAAVRYPAVVPGTALEFPRDHGAHHDHRVEWWYVSGWLREADRREYGFHLSFFRLRPGVAESSPSRFAPRQLLFAHAALAYPGWASLRYAQTAGRAGVGAASCSEQDTHVRIRDWSLVRGSGGEYLAIVAAQSLRMRLRFAPTQPLLLQGDQGYSRKGPQPAQASYYYSQPQLAVSGELNLDGKRHTVSGRAWLDHEWSSELLSPQANGWDWAAMNLDDGGAVMAFRIRDRDGDTLWAGGTWRSPAGESRQYAVDEVVFTPRRWWRSPRTGARYPVELELRLTQQSWRLAPLLDDQELDTRRTVGAVYWDGAVRAQAAGDLPESAGGLGYLEFTGYAGALRL